MRLMKKSVWIIILMLKTIFVDAAVPSSESLIKTLAETPIEAEQILWVMPPQKGVQTQLRMLTKSQGQWKEEKNQFVAVVGSKGLAEPGKKVEGDRKTPQGLYRLGKVFGKRPNTFTKMPYEILKEDMKWVDDPQSQEYNRLVRGPTSAESFETMLRKDHLYDLVMVLEYNTEPVVAGKGSAIFMHIWESAVQGTAGCVALDRSDLEKILAWIDPTKHPKILIGEIEGLAAVDSIKNRR